MDKMKMESVDMTAQNIEKIGALFPNCITETADKNGKLKKAINFDMLKQMLSDEVAEGDEAYEFTWVGKKEAIVEANKPIRKTLRPCPEESVNWDTTENLYIEGDNIDVLKLLQESYLGKVKMIYIDPPYNTGSDKFVYTDDFHIPKEEYEEMAGHKDENGNTLFRENSNSNPHFHSVWCSMIYSRLMLARNLLSDDGVIFISIDDGEVGNLRELCDEVFGNNNFVSNIIWEKKFSPQNDAKWFSDNHDHILCFAKNKDLWYPNQLPRTEKANLRYKNPDNDPRGPWASSDLSVKTYSPDYDYPIITPSGKEVSLPAGRCWMTSKANMKKLIEDNRIWFGENGNNLPRLKRFLSEVKQGITPLTIWYRKDVGDTQEAKRELLKIMPENVFQNPKSLRLIKHILFLASKKESIILDFFSGSATTAHAVMQLNAEDGGHRKFIMVQIPEKTDEKSEAYKAGYKNICEIGKERIRRAGKKILTEVQEEIADTAMHGENYEVDSVVCKHKDLDIGFRVLKLDSTNMTDVYYSPAEYSQDLLSMLESNIKADRSDLDLLFGCLLEWGLPLSLPYSSEQVDGYTVHNYNDGDLIACFDENIPESVIKEIARKQPLRAVFRDSSFADSPSKINVGEIFKLIAPDTRVKVI